MGLVANSDRASSSRLSRTLDKARDHGCVVVEQNAQMALSIATRGYVLETGKITMTGTGQELLHDDNVRKAYLGG